MDTQYYFSPSVFKKVLVIVKNSSAVLRSIISEICSWEIDYNISFDSGHLSERTSVEHDANQS